MKLTRLQFSSFEYRFTLISERIMDIFGFPITSYASALFVLFVAIGISMGYRFYGVNTTRNLTTFFAQETEFNSRVINKLRTNVGDYKPPWWYNNFLVALMGFGGSGPKIKYVRQLFTHVDGTVLFWTHTYCNAAHVLIIVVGSLFAADWYPSKPDANYWNQSASEISILGDDVKGVNFKSGVESTPTDELNIAVFIPGWGSSSSDVRMNYVPFYLNCLLFSIDDNKLDAVVLISNDMLYISFSIIRYPSSELGENLREYLAAVWLLYSSSHVTWNRYSTAEPQVSTSVMLWRSSIY